jgi:hypothetical protein
MTMDLGRAAGAVFLSVGCFSIGWGRGPLIVPVEDMGAITILFGRALTGVCVAFTARFGGSSLSAFLAAYFAKADCGLPMI